MNWWERTSDLGIHLGHLHNLAVRINAQHIIELGVRGGASTGALLAAAEITGGRVWSCDSEQHHAPYAYHPRWTFHLGDDLKSADYAPRVCDLLFIDTCHTREQTEAELALYGPRVRPGGAIAMHDADPKPGQDVMGPAFEYAVANQMRLHYHPLSHGFLVIQ